MSELPLYTLRPLADSPCGDGLDESVDNACLFTIPATARILGQFGVRLNNVSGLTASRVMTDSRTGLGRREDVRVQGYLAHKKQHPPRTLQ